MYRIIDTRGSGKTSRLLLLAKEYNGIIVSSNPGGMAQKARSYGFYNIRCEDYYWLVYNSRGIKQPIFIDELDLFLQNLNNNIQGYSISIED